MTQRLALRRIMGINKKADVSAEEMKIASYQIVRKGNITKEEMAKARIFQTGISETV